MCVFECVYIALTPSVYLHIYTIWYTFAPVVYIHLLYTIFIYTSTLYMYIIICTYIRPGTLYIVYMPELKRGKIKNNKCIIYIICAHTYQLLLHIRGQLNKAVTVSFYFVFFCIFIFFTSIKLYPKTHFDLLLSGLYDRFYYFIVLKAHI